MITRERFEELLAESMVEHVYWSRSELITFGQLVEKEARREAIIECECKLSDASVVLSNDNHKTLARAMRHGMDILKRFRETK